MSSFARFNNAYKALHQIESERDSFCVFEHIYLFGSILHGDAIPNDIDLLLTYKEYSDSILCKTALIRELVEEACELPCDLTVLSMDELRETDFLNSIKTYCQIK